MQRIFRTLQPLYRFSSKKDARIKSKIEEAQHMQATQNLDSVAEQHVLTYEQAEVLVEKRKQLIQDLAKNMDQPKEVNYIMLATLSPLIFLSSATLISCMNPAYTVYAGQLMHATLKYASVNVAFQSGIHWGFAMSQHETQLDWLNSSSEARRTFFLATLPIIGAILISQYFLYGSNDNIHSVSAIIGIMSLNIFVNFLDIRAKGHAPGWFLKSKLKYTILFNAALAPLIYSLFIHSDNFKNKPSIYRVIQ